jgi:hypothetical protein
VGDGFCPSLCVFIPESNRLADSAGLNLPALLLVLILHLGRSVFSTILRRSSAALSRSAGAPQQISPAEGETVPVSPRYFSIPVAN